MTSVWKTETKTGEFTIDIAKINKCKGVLYIEVKPYKRLDTLILDNIESDLISYKNVFKLQSSKPMVNGELKFKPYNSDSDMKSIVRFLLAQP